MMAGFVWTEGVGDRTMIAYADTEAGHPVRLVHYTLLDVIQVESSVNGAPITTVAQIEADGEDLDAVLGRHGFTPTTPAETPDPFTWHKGIPSRDRFTYGRVGDVPVKVTHLTLLRLVMIEETKDRMPVRTMSSIDVPAGVDVEVLLSTLKVVPA